LLSPGRLNGGVELIVEYRKRDYFRSKALVDFHGQHSPYLEEINFVTTNITSNSSLFGNKLIMFARLTPYPWFVSNDGIRQKKR